MKLNKTETRILEMIKKDRHGIFAQWASYSVREFRAAHSLVKKGICKFVDGTDGVACVEIELVGGQ